MMPDALREEISKLVSAAAARDGILDIGEELKRLAAREDEDFGRRRDLVNAMVSESLRLGVTPQLPII